MSDHTVKVEFVGAEGKYDSVELNYDRIFELMLERDMWSIRDAVRYIIKHELSLVCFGIISISSCEYRKVIA